MIYRAMWEIVDDQVTTSELLADAQLLLEAMAARDGARLVGERVWTFTDDRLLCEVEAEETDPVIAEEPEEPADPIDADVLRYNAMGWANRQIAALLGVDPKTVRRCLTRYGKRSPHRPGRARTAVDMPVDEP